MTSNFTIARDKSIIPALDVDTLEKALQIVRATADIEAIGGYKLGFSLALRYGLPRAVQEIRAISGKPLIYDHQKAGTDIPDTGADFAAACKQSGINTVIFFPQAGPKTQKAWIDAAQAQTLGVIVGVELTGPAYLESDGGYLRADTPEKTLSNALQNGVREFVVPGNKPERIAHYKKLIESGEAGVALPEGQYAFYSPGLVAQGGSVTQGAKAAGKRWHAIVGRALALGSEAEIRKAAEGLSAGLG